MKGKNVKGAVTNGKNMETDNRGNGQSTTGTNNDGQRGNAQGEGNDLRRVSEHGRMQGNGREISKSKIFKSVEVGANNAETVNRIKDI
ncbi:MAG: hypothetical protein UH854_04745 [Clostridia bacterium]|nr:hypothetical protein [Clostridia bacterium]